MHDKLDIIWNDESSSNENSPKEHRKAKIINSYNVRNALEKIKLERMTTNQR